MSSSNMAFTHIDVRKTKFTWKIDNFIFLLSSSLPTGKSFNSPTFAVKPGDGMEWNLSLYPNGYSDSYRDFLSISLNCSKSSNELCVKYSLCTIDKTGRKMFERTGITGTTTGIIYSIYKFMPTDVLYINNNDLLLNNVLTICCELTVVYKNSLNSDETIKQPAVDVTNKILIAFEQQLEKQQYSDVKLVASCGKELRAHKFVLAARSPVFSAMFTNDTKEKNDHSVVIRDLDYDSLKEMLRFMYAGKVENMNKVAEGVLAAQEKYQIEGLKELYEEHFFQNINIENVLTFFIFSVRFNLDKIKLLCEQFIRCHVKDVSQSAAFKAIDEPNVVTEIVNILADK